MTEVEYVDSSKVSCDGGKGDLGHPKVYLDMGTKQEVVCPYCGKRFVLGEDNSSNSSA